MSDEDAGGDAADTAGNGGDRLYAGFYFIKSHISGDAALFFVPVDADIDDDLMGIGVFLCDAVELSGGGDQDISLSRDRGDVNGACVAVDDSGVFMHQHHTHRASDDQGASDDSCFFTLDGNIKMVQDLHGCLGCAGRKAGLCICKDAG